MCKKCFAAYDRCTKQMHTLKASLAKAVEVLLDDMGLDCDPAPPPPKRAAVSLGPSSASPDVTVNKVLLV